MRNLLKLLLTLSICTTLFSCRGSNEAVRYIEIGESQNSLEYICSVKDYNKLIEVLSGRPSVEVLHKTIGIDFIKTISNGYSTVFRTNEGLIEVKFDANKNHISTKKLFLNPNISELDMDQISVGNTLTFVRSVDPWGDYPFLYASQSGTTAISSHYLENGISYRFYYDEEWCVIAIEKSFL